MRTRPSAKAKEVTHNYDISVFSLFITHKRYLSLDSISVFFPMFKV